MTVDSVASYRMSDVGRWVKFLAIWLIALFGLLTPNPLLTTVGIGVLPVLAALLWRPGQPPILLLAVLNQWAQVFVPVLRADLAGQRVGEYIRLPEIELAAWLGLITVVGLAFGMRLGVGHGAALDDEAIDRWALQVKGTRLAAVYSAALALAFMLPDLAWLVQSLRQPILILGGLRWIAAFIILWLAVIRNDLRLLAATVVLVETVIGLGSYFSDFKTVYILGVVALLSVRSRSSRIAWAGLAVVGAVAIGLGVVWQVVKVEYRPFLSQGEGSQAVLVSPSERYAFLVERTLNLGAADLSRGLESGVDRLGYLEYFARAIQMVPSQIPFQDGQLWWEAVLHLVTPRALFPDKTDINDSDRTNAFCGVRVSGAEQGTSISIGYAGESYIDFGPMLMFGPILLLGMFWGWGLRWLSNCSPARPLGIAAGVVFVMSGALYFESSNIKILGGGVTALIAWTLLLRLGGGKMGQFLTGGSSSG